VGPAGAGKTTLYQKLDCYTKLIQLENFPDVRKMTDAPFFISNGLGLIPNLLPLYRPGSRQLTRREFAWMSILNGWPAVLRNQLQKNNRAIVLDQGPVYLMTEVRLFGPEYLRQQTAQRFWQNLFEHWTDTLDMIVWLDTAEEVLLERIRTRQQEHVVKAQPAKVVYEFLDRYRSEYEFIFSRLIANNTCLKVLRFDTGWQTPQQIVDQILFQLSG
jgi:deoxyadenosine/deoxycytidine kinase